MNSINHHHLSGRFVIRVMVFLFALLISLSGFAQEDELRASSLENRLRISPTLLTTIESLPLNPQGQSVLILPENGIWLPEFARENPAGHAPLCRMEVRLENQMTVPLWIRAGGFDSLPQFGSGNLYVRMKLLRF